MKTYRVWARMTTYCYLEVEAESKEEALNIAYEEDGGCFVEDDGPYGCGSWDIMEDDVEEIE